MRRFATYLAKVVAMIIATSCTMNELLEPTFPSSSSDNLITISPRITHYTDYDVTTRSAKEGDEAKVTSMAMALFPIVDGQIQPSVYYQYNGDGNMLFVLDRHKPPFTDANGNEPYKDKQFVMYIIANMQGSGIPETSGNSEGVGWTPEQFVEKYHSINANECFEKIGENGLPMIGMLGDVFSEYGDRNTFIFHPAENDSANKNRLPTVNGIPTDNLEIPMRSLYAKFSFTINVDSEQEIVGNPAPRFDLLGYQVVNASSKVYLDRQLNEDNDQTGYEDVVTSEFHNVLSEGLYAQGATKATFSFYVPERYLTPNTPASAYEYDFGENGGTCNGYENIPGELKKYAQRFKPDLVKGQKATHVAIKGTFTDHQKHVYNVTYRIYLGKDNYGDFNIIRNTHYNNFITIKGIDNSDDQSANYDPDNLPDDAIAPISIDHRVSIERTTPLVVGLRRETLLDAHIEVRPLRLHLSGGDPDTNPTSATVTLKKVKDSDPELSWIGMEKSGNTDAYITGTRTPSDGKRKYFTTDLIASIYNNAVKNDDGNIVITIDGLGYDANQTIWLYADENTTTNARSAVLQIEYNYKDPDTQEVAAPENFIITQHGLFKVTGAESGRDYYIENFEEYLYNYDVEDSYGQTKQEGMQWGLDGVQLSNEHRSFTNNTNNTDWNNYLNNNILPTYDFYIQKHDGTFAAAAGATMVHSYAGQHFTEDIVKKSNNGVRNLTMDQQASGAVEYCYNRNKRNPDGSISKILWYLPSADELEDFIVPAYASFEEFQDNYYWTSQPAYIRNVYYYEDYSNTFPFIVYDDNPEYARATKVVAKGNNVYDYALSGLNEKTNVIDPNTKKILDFTGSGEKNFGYFNLMYRWKSGTADKTYGQDGFGGNVNGTQYKGEEFDEKLDGRKTGNRYHVHLGHLYDMTQEGYHHRNQKNRVRCVRADLSTNNQQMVLVYTVSKTAATSLDDSGSTMYVMQNTGYTSTYLTTSGDNVQAESSSLVGSDNCVVIEGNKIKSVAKNQYFNGYNGNVSFNNSGINYTISNSYRISYKQGDTTYYLKQTDDDSVSMSSGNNGNRTWKFYEVTKEYKVVEQ